ncbi:hypothetical protein BT96DRAFT_66839 [Gymnopus androsaceus JB14]|uniref:F-box domain-containing protein n=1 Tax=Gymnopus androsaceus JB14 TaxID=1447944 RepID=A0A6A4HGF0_9AGAR|nr:hypothetical protein BT96DRAFT_66839 [Gymnopus androsaceus JB14]
MMDDCDVLSPIRGALSSLRTFHFVLDSTLESCATIDAFEYAPQLEELFLTCRPNLVKCILLPWTQIHRFRYGMEHSSQISLALLTEMPNLVSCVLGDISFTSGLHLQDCSLRVASLMSLTLNLPKTNIYGIRQVLDNISAPSLESLELLGVGNSSKINRDLVDALSNFFQRSCCNLRSLALSSPSSISADIISLIRIIPSSLTKLSITSFG